MKHITKNPEPQSFIEWQALENENWKPHYEDLNSKVKNELKQSLLCEQGYICCYCEIRIESSTSHIEHLKPQKPYKELELEYTNLLCSCGNPVAGNPLFRNPDRCGNKRRNWYDEQEFVTPLDPTCEDRIVCRSNGELGPVSSDDGGAQTTIDILNLNQYNLVQARKKVIGDLCYLELSHTDIEKLLFYNGKYHDFYTSIKQFFKL